MILQTDAILVLSRMLDSSETQLSSASSISQLAKHGMQCDVWSWLCSWYRSDDLRGAILRTDTIPIMVKLVNSKDTQLRSAGINHVLQLVQHSTLSLANIDVSNLLVLQVTPMQQFWKQTCWWGFFACSKSLTLRSKRVSSCVALPHMVLFPCLLLNDSR